MKTFFLGLALVSSLAAAAQTASPTFSSGCRDQGSSDGQEFFCETRDLTMPAPSGQPLTIDGGQNGGINVKGWDGADVRVRATVKTWGSSPAQARERAQALRINTSGNALRASTTDHASVNFEVFVPRRAALALATHNGSIALSGVQGTITFRAQNGAVSLAELGGQISGNTTNGAVAIRLSGPRWDGTGLDVSTTNGDITWHLPADYSAEFFTSTRNGFLRTALPAKTSGNQHEVQATLGQGGRPVKAITNNGSVAIRQG